MKIRDRQLNDIIRSRKLMAEIFSKLKIKNALFVGEGVLWSNTFLGYCIIHGMLPSSLTAVTVVDVCIGKGITFFDDIVFESFKGLRIEAYKCDATDLPFLRNSFDVSISPLMIDDCSNHLKLVNELYRCTKPKKFILVSGHGLDTHSYLKMVPGLYGSSHINQADPRNIDKLFIERGGIRKMNWFNEHCWIKMFEKPFKINCC